MIPGKHSRTYFATLCSSMLFLAVCACAHAGWVLEVSGTTTYQDPQVGDIIFGGGNNSKIGYWMIERLPFTGSPYVDDDYSESYARMRLTSTITFTKTDSDCQKWIEAQIKYLWRWQGPSGGSAQYNFSFDVRGIAGAYASVEVYSTAGIGKFVSHGYAKLLGDTATAEPVQDEQHIWAGAEYVANSGGKTGTGEGSTEGSMQWTGADPYKMDPSASVEVDATISATDDDPGDSCFVEISTSALVRCEDFKYTFRYNNECVGHGWMDLEYRNHLLKEPQPL